jgi:hypothetical protein
MSNVYKRGEKLFQLNHENRESKSARREKLFARCSFHVDALIDFHSRTKQNVVHYDFSLNPSARLLVNEAILGC